VELKVDFNRLQDSLKNAIDLNTRFYSSLLDLSTQYLRALGSIIATTGQGQSGPGQSGDPHARPAGPQSNAGGSPTPPLLLAARAGEEARAAFIVENTLPHGVSARVVPRGLSTAVRLVVQPETVTLAPGGQSVVQLSAPIGKELDSERDYPGELAIPELASRTIPFVVRRLPDAAGSKP
jgi:hypothetical protein